MKIIWQLIIVIGMAFAGSLQAQSPVLPSRVPEEVKNDFELRYHDARNVMWYKLPQSQLGARFKMEAFRAEAIYDGMGNWVQTVEDIAFASLPDSARVLVLGRYPHHDARDVQMVSSRSLGIIYEMKLAGEGELVVLNFDMNGMLLEESLETIAEVEEEPSAGKKLKGKFNRLLKNKGE